MKKKIQPQGVSFGSTHFYIQRYNNSAKKVEDILYAESAKLALQEGVLSAGESKKILDSI